MRTFDNGSFTNQPVDGLATTDLRVHEFLAAIPRDDAHHEAVDDHGAITRDPGGEGRRSVLRRHRKDDLRRRVQRGQHLLGRGLAMPHGCNRPANAPRACVCLLSARRQFRSPQPVAVQLHLHFVSDSRYSTVGRLRLLDSL